MMYNSKCTKCAQYFRESQDAVAAVMIDDNFSTDTVAYLCYNCLGTFNLWIKDSDYGIQHYDELDGG